MLRVALAVDLIAAVLEVLARPGSGAVPVGIAIFVIVTAVAIAVGVLTVPAAALSAALVAASAVLGPTRAAGAAVPLGTAGFAIALLLTGPGAYAIDARRHGRREIVVPRPQTPLD